MVANADTTSESPEARSLPPVGASYQVRTPSPRVRSTVFAAGDGKRSGIGRIHRGGRSVTIRESGNQQIRCSAPKHRLMAFGVGDTGRGSRPAYKIRDLCAVYSNAIAPVFGVSAVVRTPFQNTRSSEFGQKSVVGRLYAVWWASGVEIPFTELVNPETNTAPLPAGSARIP